MRESRAARAVREAAFRAGWPRENRSDLDVDLEFLGGGDPPEVFLWALTPSETCLIWPSPRCLGRPGSPAELLDECRRVAKAVRRLWPGAEWYLWDGSLRKLSKPDVGLERLRSHYRVKRGRPRKV